MAARPPPSQAPLARKLGFLGRVYAPGVPRGLAPTLEGLTRTARLPAVVEQALLFARSQAELARWFTPLAPRLTPAPRLWVCYPKGRSGVATDLSRDHGWALTLAEGFDTVAICAVDAVWAAVRLKR
jgi:hypothetical protein